MLAYIDDSVVKMFILEGVGVLLIVQCERILGIKGVTKIQTVILVILCSIEIYLGLTLVL